MDLKILEVEGFSVDVGSRARRPAVADVIYGASGKRDFAIYRIRLSGRNGFGATYILAEGDDPYACDVRDFLRPKTIGQEEPLNGGSTNHPPETKSSIKLGLSLSVRANADIEDEIISALLEADLECQKAADTPEYRAKSNEFDEACKELFRLLVQ